MGSNLADLAKQLEQALAEEEAARLRTDAARAAWRAGAADQRTALLDELQEFALSLEVVEVSRHTDRLQLTWGRQVLGFVEHADGDVVDLEYARSGADEAIRLTTQGVWRWDRDGESAPLLTAGLEELLVRGLGLPRPGGAKPGDAVSSSKPEPHEPAPTATVTKERGRGPNDGEPGFVGRAGTRGFKRPKKIQPGAIVKEIKGPLD